jgi:hypothetical protein
MRESKLTNFFYDREMQQKGRKTFNRPFKEKNGEFPLIIYVDPKEELISIFLFLISVLIITKMLPP